MIKLIKKHNIIWLFTTSSIIPPFIVSEFKYGIFIFFPYLLCLLSFNHFFKIFEKPINSRIATASGVKFKFANKFMSNYRKDILVLKNTDGKIILIAKEFNLVPIIKENNIWSNYHKDTTFVPHSPAYSHINLNDFKSVFDKKEQLDILKHALINYTLNHDQIIPFVKFE